MALISLRLPMALQRHLWYTGWALVTSERIIGNFILS